MRFVAWLAACLVLAAAYGLLIAFDGGKPAPDEDPGIGFAVVSGRLRVGDGLQRPAGRVVATLHGVAGGLPFVMSVQPEPGGEFRLGGMPRGHYTVHFDPPAGDGWTSVPITPVDATRDSIRGLTLELVVGLVIDGRVVSAGGEPVPDARVAALIEGDPARVHWPASCAADGRFTLRLPAQRSYRLIVTQAPPPYVATGNELLPIQLDTAAPAPVELSVPLGTPVTGRVVEEDGTPVEGVEVFTVTPPGITLQSAHSGADGTFRLEGVTPGAHEVSAVKDGRRGGADVGPAAAREPVTIVLSPERLSDQRYQPGADSP